MVYQYKEITGEILSELSPRTREVISRRFGLEGRGKETLQAIGEDHGITRERVRQIEGAGLKKARPKTQSFGPVFEFFSNQLRTGGGLRREDVYLNILGPSSFKNHIFFLLVLRQEFERVKETDHFHTLWTEDVSVLDQARELADHIAGKLKKEGRPVQGYELEKVMKMEPPLLFGVLSVSKKVDRGPQGLWGLSDWSVIKPRGTRDRTYIVLKEKKKPLHFREIARIINESRLFSSEVNIHPQTVHNELIKHPDFVLVGRGTYGLKEWGYEPGTVREVIERVLREKGPLTRDRIVEEVLERRMVKRNTVLLNLRNGKEFKQDKEGRYMLVETEV